MDPKKMKSSKKAKVAEAMKKKARGEGLEKEVPLVVLDHQLSEAEAIFGASHSELPPSSPLPKPRRKRQREVPILVPPPLPSRALDIQSYFIHKYRANCSLQEDGPSLEMAHHCLVPLDALNANNMNFARITKLKGGYTEMEVKMNEMEDVLKSAEVALREQEARHKADIDALDAELEKLKEENQDFLAKNKDFEGKDKHLEEDWDWVNGLYLDRDDEDEEERDVGGDVHSQDRHDNDSSPLRVDTKVSADIHPISSKGRGTANDVPSK
ncbi:hypothetical protein JCGZ_09499 [Jatropha curcas]|uniref:Uncharacterized protein n=1 Tax=Jatropha curcas TaxID=180498 RepID=A0A067KJR8_JATCU|nr:hypothetical protein JCGZ_09499 [Jatropha curcas]